MSDPCQHREKCQCARCDVRDIKNCVDDPCYDCDREEPVLECEPTEFPIRKAEVVLEKAGVNTKAMRQAIREGGERAMKKWKEDQGGDGG